jgi:anti-anti-sigma factor
VNDLAHVERDDRNGRPLIRISGEIDMSNVADVEEQIATLSGSDRLPLFDLSFLEFIDSTGVAMFARMAERAHRREDTLTIVIPDGTPVHRVLKLVGLTPMIEIRSQLDDV